MIDHERVTAYIHSLETEDFAVLEEIRKEALENQVPIIRSETASLIRVLVTTKQPKSILEIGTAVGYSALVMRSCAGEDCHITTIENYEKRIPIAKENFIKAGATEQITLLEGDATEILSNLTGQFDLIFMDAAKAQYITWLPDILRLLAKDGMLISDNVLQDGDVLESKYAVTRRDRTIHGRMREYLYALTHTEDLLTSILPVGDGVAITVPKCGQ